MEFEQARDAFIAGNGQRPPKDSKNIQIVKFNKNIYFIKNL